MVMPLDQLPDHVEQLIAPFVSPLPDGQHVEIHVGRLPFAHTPKVIIVQDFPEATFPEALRAVATAIGTDIYIDPSYADFETAAGLSLLVHERVHVDQFVEDPEFLVKYNIVNQEVPSDQPWLNPYEWEAYQTECQAYDYYLSLGYPPGDWQPLGYVMGFCN